nr:transposase [Paracoccus chinensis]
MVRNKAVYIALGVTREGEREVLGLWIAHVRDPGREPHPRVGRHRDHAVSPRISRARTSGS